MFLRFQYFLFFFLCFANFSSAQHTDFSFEKLFEKYPDSFDSIVSNKEKYRLQILYTRIDRDQNNVPHLKTYSFDADKYYYYCASLIKFPGAVLSLEKINNLKQYQLNKNDSISIDSIYCDALNPENLMLTSKNPSIAQFIKEIFLVSNNKAFNPLYDFLGQKYFNDRLHNLGYTSALVSNRFSSCDTTENRRCNPVSFYERGSGRFKFQQPCVINETQPTYNGSLNLLVGNAYLGDGMLNKRPKDFSFLNYLPLQDFHSLLTKIIFPETQTSNQKLNLFQADYNYLHKCMGMFPRESSYPVYDSVNFPDHFMKYFIGLDSGNYQMPANIRVFNKVGQAYGFMTDCSYVLDTLNKVEFFLSCSMYLNEDGILNDGKYEYDQIGFPFFHNLFNAIYEEELLRPKKFAPIFAAVDFTDSSSFHETIVLPFIDTTQCAEEIEAKLCLLADSMWATKKYTFSNEGEITEKLFVKALSLALSCSKFSHSSFEKLQQKKILISFSEKKNFAAFSWNSKNCLLRYTDNSGAVFVKNTFSKDLPKLSYNKVFEVLNSQQPVFLLTAFTDEKLNRSEYIQAFALVNNQLEKLRIFKMEENLFSDILVESSNAESMIKFDKKHAVLSFPMMTISKGKTVTKTTKMKFDGKLFKN